MNSLTKSCIGEVIGTFLLVLFGTGAVASAVLTGALTGLWQVAVVWGFGITIAIYASSAASGAHLNPAVTLAFALLRPAEFPRERVLPYWAAQMIGAMLAGAVILATFGPFIGRFETEHTITRGAAGSETSAMVFGEYFPNPAIFGTGGDAAALVSPLRAVAVEAFGTAVLVLVIFALTDPRNTVTPGAMTPLLIGFTVAVLISLFAPLTQAGWNPARDFGPRVIAFLAGWGEIAIPGPRAGFWVYIVGPLFGGPLGGAFYDVVLRPSAPASTEA